jgi:hypothetical protein
LADVDLVVVIPSGAASDDPPNSLATLVLQILWTGTNRRSKLDPSECEPHPDQPCTVIGCLEPELADMWVGELQKWWARVK